MSVIQAEFDRIETPVREKANTAVSSGPGRVLLIAVWFGLLCGLFEGITATVLRGVPGFAVRVSPEILWIAPVFNLLLFILIGIAASIAFRIIGKTPDVKWILGLFVWITIFDLFLLTGKLQTIAALILSLGIAVQVARTFRSRELRVLNSLRKTVAVLLVGALLAGAVGATWRGARERYLISKLPQPQPNSPNVLLITLDTLRADHLSSYGYNRATTPNLDKLASQGALFENAIATSSWTLPSHASLFTGRLPYEHNANWTEPLNGRFPTLAEALAGRGYLTVAFAANYSYVASEWGLARGFSRFETHGGSLMEEATTTVYGKKAALTLLPRVGYFDIPGRKSASQVNQQLLDWMSRKGDRPFFAFLNYFDIHDPYLVKSPQETQFSNEVTRGDLINHQYQGGKFRRKATLTEKEIQSEINSYDGCLAYLDARLGELFAELEKRGLDKNTLVIITSDHGEAFGNHDLFGHGNSLFMETLHVPLIFYWPGKIPAGARVPNVVSLHNVPTTVMQLLGNTSSTEFPGSSLATLWGPSQNTWQAEPVLSELSPGRFLDGPANYPAAQGSIRSLTTEKWHFLLSESGRTELYAWRNDPKELHNLADTPEGRIAVQEFQQRLSSLPAAKNN